MKEFEGSSQLISGGNQDGNLPAIDSEYLKPVEDTAKSVKTEAEPPSPVFPININSADKTELMAISGIGPVLANAIIEYRRKNGSFENLSDLINVKGIGPKKLAKITPFVEINNGK